MSEQESLGERRVRYSFNPSGDKTVDEIKRTTALLIDLCEVIKDRSGGTRPGSDVARWCSLAQTHYEDAAMWAVKAATFGK